MFSTRLLPVSDPKCWHSDLQKTFRKLKVSFACSLSSPIDLQHHIQPIIDVHAAYDAMQEIVRLGDIEQLHENVTHEEKHMLG